MNEDVLSESGLRTPHSVYRSGVLLLPPLSVFLFVFAFAFVCLDGGASVSVSASASASSFSRQVTANVRVDLH